MKHDRAEHSVQKSETHLDAEWVNLMLEARQLGLTPDDVRNFLKGVVGNTLKS